jgi:alcohol dehydrogenase YqhD (iron-dependent ADH family)
VRGSEHPETLTIMVNLAGTYQKQARWQQAEALQKQVVNARKRVIGEKHRRALNVMRNLAHTYRNLGEQRCLDYEALEEEIKSLEAR